MRHRYISYFAGIFLLAFFAVLNTGVLISVSGFQRLQKPVVSQPDFPPGFDFCQWISETSKTGGISA